MNKHYIFVQLSLQYCVTNMKCILCFIFCIICFVNGGQPNPRICPDIISRTRWGARVPVSVEYAIRPVEYVVIHHTVTPGCNNENECSNLLMNMQTFHMDNLDFHDIGYNFLIGGDGKVYEGTGWHRVGAHTRGYNRKSIGLGFIGTFTDSPPTKQQLKAAQDFLQCGVEIGELDTRYKLFGARQVSATQSPGLKLYHEIQNWSHFTANPK